MVSVRMVSGTAIMMAAAGTAMGGIDFRAIDLTAPENTQGQVAYSVADPDRAVFAFNNSGASAVQGTLAINLVSLLDEPYEVLWSVYRTEAGALAGDVNDRIFSEALVLAINPNPVSSGTGENLNYLASFLFQLDGSALESQLWVGASLSRGQLSVANVPDPVGQQNYLVQGTDVLSFSDLEQFDRSWAVELHSIPAPSTALLGIPGLIAFRRRPRRHA